MAAANIYLKFMIDIRKATEKDLTAIINIHNEIFDKSHLTSNFPRILLEKYFYKLISKNTYNYVAYDEEDRLAGYIISGYKTNEAIREFVSENRMSVIKVLLLHPNFLFEKIFYSLFNRSQKKNNLRLLFIGVKPSQGIGRNMISHFEKEIVRDGVYEYGLSVRKNNSRAKDFYQKNGFIIENKIFNSISYIKKLTANDR